MSVIYSTYGSSNVQTFQGGGRGSAWDPNFTGVYHFNALNAKDSTQNARDGILGGSTPPTAGTGPFGNGSLDFVGAGQVVVNGTPLATGTLASQTNNLFGFGGRAGLFSFGFSRIATATPTGFSVEAWVKTPSTAVNGTIWITDLGSVVFYVWRNGADYEAVMSGAVSATATDSGGVTINAWTHIVVTYDGATLRLYRDGIQRASASAPFAGSVGGTSNSIGAHASTSTAFWYGQISEVRTSTICRSSDYVVTQYNLGHSAFSHSMVTSGGEVQFGPTGRGVDSTANQPLNVGSDVTAIRGSTTLTLKTPVPLSNPPTYLVIQYYRLGQDSVVCENTAQVAARAAIEHGSGVYQQFTSDSQNQSYTAVLAEAQKILSTYGQIANAVTVDTYQTGLLPGQYMSVAVSEPVYAAGYINGSWRIQQVQLRLVPGMTAFLRTITITSSIVPATGQLIEQLLLGQ